MKIMKKKLVLFPALTMLIAVLSVSPSNGQMKSSDKMSSGRSEELRLNMRNLWQEHVAWTRNVVLCIADGLPGTDQAVNRLLQNQDDIGNAIKSFYGEEAGKQLST